MNECSIDTAAVVYVARTVGERSVEEIHTTDGLLPLVYRELRALAAMHMAGELTGHTMQPTALVNEAYLRLRNSSGEFRWNSRAHFFGAAAEAMRRILVERARHRQTVRAGGRCSRVPLDDIGQTQALCPLEMLALHDALTKLEEKHPRKALLVKLRFFAGMAMHEAAATLGISLGTAEDDWVYARSLLKLEMRSSRDINPDSE